MAKKQEKSGKEPIRQTPIEKVTNVISIIILLFLVGYFFFHGGLNNGNASIPIPINVPTATYGVTFHIYGSKQCPYCKEAVSLIKQITDMDHIVFYELNAQIDATSAQVHVPSYYKLADIITQGSPSKGGIPLIVAENTINGAYTMWMGAPVSKDDILNNYLPHLLEGQLTYKTLNAQWLLGTATQYTDVKDILSEP